MFTLAFLCVAGISLAKENSGAYIQNNVSATANTGDNHISGSGSIKTGNASAESSVKTEVNSSGNTEIDIEAQAEANGEKVEASVESKNSDENIDIHKETGDENASASVDVEINTNISQDANAAEQNVDEAKKGIFASVKETVKSFIGKIISLFA